MFEGCPSCHAQAVGEPLARPEQQLLNYGRAGFLVALGTVLFLAFAVTTGLAWYNLPFNGLKFWDFVAAGETASWQLRYLALPVAVMGLLLGSRMVVTIKRNPRFAGLKLAYGGLAVTAVMALLMANLIGITIPARMQQQQIAADAGAQIDGYTIERATLTYRHRYGTLPASLDDLARLPDPDGSIARAVARIPTDSYRPWSVQAAAPGSKTLNGARVRPASARVGTSEATEGLSFTNYELHLPGLDRKLNTEDDWIMRDGVMQRAPVVPSVR